MAITIKYSQLNTAHATCIIHAMNNNSIMRAMKECTSVVLTHGFMSKCIETGGYISSQAAL